MVIYHLLINISTRIFTLIPPLLLDYFFFLFPKSRPTPQIPPRSLNSSFFLGDSKLHFIHLHHSLLFALLHFHLNPLYHKPPNPSNPIHGPPKEPFKAHNPFKQA